MRPFQNQVTNLGLAYSRYGDRPFGIYLQDRLTHAYILGQTGTGKSTLLHNMAMQDAHNSVGFCLIDPHGDLAQQLTQTIKREHVYWDMGNARCPYGYNPLTRVSEPLRPLVASGLIETLQKQWADAWGPRMEHLLRYAILALLSVPNSDLRDIVCMFVEKDFRREVLSYVSDEQVLRFWTHEFLAMNYKTAVDGVAPIANKLGAFLAHPLVRKAVCQPEQPLRLRKIMDEGQVLIVNLAKGRIGNDVSDVLGGLILSSITNAAFTRHNVPEHERRPFMLYVDEFHAFSTMVFANQLAEARKYGLGVTLSQQHTAQSDKQVLASVLGNVGSVICFRVGAQDAPLLAKQLGDVQPRDLLGQPNYQACVRLMIEGVRSKVFSMTTMKPLVFEKKI